MCQTDGELCVCRICKILITTDRSTILTIILLTRTFRTGLKGTGGYVCFCKVLFLPTFSQFLMPVKGRRDTTTEPSNFSFNE